MRNCNKLITLIILFTYCISKSQCYAPTNINLINNIALTNTVELSWTENGNATDWEIAIVPDFNVSSTIPIDGWISTSSNPFIITGIAPTFNCYAFFVRSVCSQTVVSPWSAIGTLGCSVASYNWLLTLSNDSFSLNSSRLQIYPNPTKNIFQIKNNSKIEKLKIFDALGKEILIPTLNNNEINIENLSKGIYLIEIYTENKKVYKKIIKE